MKRVLAIFIGAVLIIVIALTVFIKIYITPERVRTFLIPAAEKALNRKVDIGAISINLLKGIGVRDFAIKESDTETDFLKCKDFILKFKLLPLLTKRVIIDELTLVSPEVMIERDLKGAFNFEDIGPQKKPEKEEKAKAEASGLPISLLVSNVSVKDSKFSFIDRIKKLPDVKGSFDIKLNIKSADSDEIYSEGDIGLTLDEVVIQKPSEKKLRNISAALKYAAGINIGTNDIKIDKADLKVREIPVSLKGRVSKIKTTPAVDLSVSLPKVKTAKLLEAVVDFVDLKGLSLSGDVSADLKLSGMPQKLETMKSDGDVLLDAVRIKYNEIDTLLDGSLKFKEKTMHIDLKSTRDKNTAALTGRISRMFKNQDISLALYSKQLYLDQLIPAGKAKTETKKDEVPPKRKADREAGPIKLAITAQGEIRVDTAFYNGMEMKNFLALYKFGNNKLEITKLTAEAGKGKFNLNSTVDLSKPGYTYSMTSSIDSLHADELVNAFSPKAKDTVFGIISSNVKLNGAGTLPASIKGNLTGTVDFNVQDGKITNSKFSENLSLLLGIGELRTINFKQAEGKVDIKNSIARVDSIFSSNDLEMDPKGNIGLNETLDLAFELRLSPRLTDKAVTSKVTQYMKSDKGWGVIPLKVSGTLSAPKYRVDVEKAGKRVIEKEVDKVLDKFFKRDKEKAPLEGEKKPTPDNEKPIKNLLKGIF